MDFLFCISGKKIAIMYKWADSQHITVETMETTKNWEGGRNPFMVLDPKWAGYVPSSATHLEITVLVVVIVPSPLPPSPNPHPVS
jgi:hypothetical protein